MKDVVTVVRSGYNEGMDQNLGSREQEGWVEVDHIFVEKGSSGNLIDVLFKRQFAVKNDSEVVDVCGRRQSGIIEGEAIVI